MSKSLVATAGGLSAEDRAKLIPSNLRQGVVLFAGTSREVVGTLTWKDLMPDNLVLFEANMVSPLLGGWVYSSGRQPTISIGSVLSVSMPSGLPNESWSRSANKIDVTDYKTLKIILSGGSGDGTFSIGSASTGTINLGGSQVLSLDVSGISGAQYINLYQSSYYQSGSVANIARIELSKF